MIFDIILILMLITSLSRASAKGCTEDMNFVIGFFLVVRIAGAFYTLVSKILMNFISNESFAMYAAYALLVVIAFFMFNAITGQRIIEFGKKIPKTTGKVITYFFAGFKTIIIYSVIFTFINTLPVLHKFPEKFIAPKTHKLTYGVLGVGTENLFQNLSDYLTALLNNPIDYLQSSTAKQVSGSQKGIDAIETQIGLERYGKEKKPVEKKEEKEEE